MRVTLMLADAAQSANGKLYILGGGWSVTGPTVPPHAIVMKIDVPWDQANRPHDWVLELLTEDGTPVRVGAEGAAVRIEGKFESGRPEGLRPGTSIDVPLAINVAPLALEPGMGYVWTLTIDDETNDDWNRSFLVRAA